MDMYLFDKRIYKVDAIENMTEEQAEREYIEDILGAVLRYTNMYQIAKDFNNGSIKPDVFFVKIYN